MKRSKYLIFGTGVIVIILGLTVIINHRHNEDATTWENTTTQKETATEQITEPITEQVSIEHIKNISPGEAVNIDQLSLEDLKSLFYKEDISQSIKERIMGISYKENPNIALEDLCYIRVLHMGFDEKIHIGEIIVNKAIGDDVVNIMWELFENRYPIEKMLLIDEYDGDDTKSMEDNNTSGFNYRLIANTAAISNHAMGMAIDINPKYNPYITYNSQGEVNVAPKDSIEYADRTNDFIGKIENGDLCYNIFTKYGFQWGGDWNRVKDYQHFEKELT